MDAAVLIQARMGSTRLPGKVLLPLAGRSVLARVIERCREAGVGPVVVATSGRRDDEAVVEEARRAGAAVFRGAEGDVLKRFAAAARQYPARNYVRVTADCPLVDPTVIRQVVTLHVAGGYDFTYNDVPRSYPRGYDVEVMTAATLEWLERNRADGASREHVTPYLLTHPERFRVRKVSRPGDYGTYRLTLDEMADYQLIKVVYERLGGGTPFGCDEVIRLLAIEPRLGLLNAAVRQKTY